MHTSNNNELKKKLALKKVTISSFGNLQSSKDFKKADTTTSINCVTTVTL